MLVSMSTPMMMPTRDLEVVCTTNTGRRCLSTMGRHRDGGTSEAISVRVRASLIDADGIAIGGCWQ